jgi:CheY-like chemotaxis protein
VAVAQKRILVVDDDKDVLLLVRTLLSRIAVQTLTARNAAEAAQIMRQSPPIDLLILDLMLPDVSGIDFLKQMRSRSQFDAIPVVVLSALADPDQIKEALNTGADRYITKPYMANNLISVVQDVMRTGRRIVS